ncbi:MAG TPA: TetR family transcriptional regulator [Candidatus Deferrimicrobium sp.]|nr:TetR family transcriptional regulator [Candidatus Deferrimicrobium sp.]
MPSQQPETPGLSRDAVIQAALDLLDSVGVEGLSMRAVAERLGVRAASLYWHLRDKEQLLDSVAEAILDRVEVPISGAGWRGPVSAACDELGAALAAHRAAAGVVIASLPAVQRSRLVRDLARTLAVAGLEQAEGAAVALVVEAAASALLTPAPAARPRQGGAMTLAVDSGSWRVTVGAAPPGTLEAATSVGGGGAPSVDIRPDGLVVVRNRRGGNRGGVELNRDYTWNVKVHGGTWNTSLDLSGLRLSGVELDSGAGNVRCTLPRPLGVVPIRVNSGLVNVSFSRPRDAAVRATVSSGSAKVRLDGKTVRSVAADVHWETQGASASADRYELAVFSGSVRVTMDASAPPIANAATPPGAEAPPAAEPEPAQPVLPSGQGVGLLLDGIEKRLAR